MRKSTLDRRAATSGLVAAGIAASMLTPVATHLPGGQASAATDAVLTVTDAGRGIARTVTVEAAGRFRLVFEAAMNWGATQWYDLAFDPHARNNLTRSIVWPAPEFAEGGIFNQVLSGTEPDDVRLFSRPAERFFPQSPRRFEIVSATPERVVVEGTCHPIGNAVGVLDNVTVVIRYDIRPDGMVVIRSRLAVERAQSINQWLCGIFGLCDLTSGEAIIPPDSGGWIRSSATQRPYRWREPPDPFVYAYWGQQTGEHRDWARASIMLAWLGGDLPPTRHYPHNWPGYKRFGYVRDRISLPGGASVTQHWVIQLGTRAGPGLPDLSSAEACRVVLAKLAR